MIVVKVNDAVSFSHKNNIHINPLAVVNMTPDQLYQSVNVAMLWSNNRIYAEQCGSGLGPFNEKSDYSLDEFIDVIEKEMDRLNEIKRLRAYAENARKEFNRNRGSYIKKMLLFMPPSCAFPGCKSYDVTVDHIIPLILGGKNEVSNFQWLCRAHNSKKGTSTVRYIHGA